MRRRQTLDISKRVLSEEVYDRLKALGIRAGVDGDYDKYIHYVQEHLPVILKLQNHTRLKKLRFLDFALRKESHR